MAASYESNGLPLGPHASIVLSSLLLTQSANSCALSFADGINLDTEWHRNQKGYLDGNKENWYSGVFDWYAACTLTEPVFVDLWLS